MKKSQKQSISALSMACAVWLAFPPSLVEAAEAETYRPLPVFSDPGTQHRLDLRIRAVNKPVNIGGYTVNSNVFEICRLNRQGGRAVSCNTGNEYAGGRLLLGQGGALGINLINTMAPTPFADGAEAPLTTNLHTHGLIVRANGAAAQDCDKDCGDDRLKGDPLGNTFGDFVFPVITPRGAPHVMKDGMKMDAAAHPLVGDHMQFDIRIPDAPAKHPSGIFWFHPHSHGVAKLQVSGGMAGMINVGKLSDYACKTVRPDRTGCLDTYKNGELPVRHMLLKDAQIINLDVAGSKPQMFYDQDPGFCAASASDDNVGACAGGAPALEDGQERPGKWIYTINGVMHPAWNIKPGTSEIWRIQNASANVTYDLSLSGGGWPDPTAGGESDPSVHGMPFQIIALDGASLGSQGIDAATGNQTLKDRVLLMPGSRAEILVGYRSHENCTAPDQASCPTATPPSDTQIKLRTARYPTGGDDWPRIELASVNFIGDPNRQAGGPGALRIPPIIGNKDVFFSTLSNGALTNSKIQELCESGLVYKLAPGDKRRIYFGIANDGNGTEDFLLGQTIVTKDGQELLENGAPAASGPVMRTFNMASGKAQLCLTRSGSEVWQLVNVSPEVHNFHIHQNKFSVLSQVAGCSGVSCPMRTPSAIDKVNIPVNLVFSGGKEELRHDTIIVPRGGEGCLDKVQGGVEPQDPSDDTSPTVPVTQWQFKKIGEGQYMIDQAGITGCRGDGAGIDASGAITLKIPFDRVEQIGKYVFHCHILEHEDKGMMSSIRVMSDAQMDGAAAPPSTQ
jgi:L-ascorbate oxidase